MAKPANRINYYSLDYPPPNHLKQKTASIVLGIETFDISRLYDTKKIVFKEKPFKRDAYVYHRWWLKPNELVTCFLTRDLKESGLFQSVHQGTGDRFETHRVTGSVDEFFELETEKGWYGIISIGVTLIRIDGKKSAKGILFQKTYAAKEPCLEKNPEGLARAMSRAMAGISSDMIRDIYQKCALSGK